MNTRYPAAVLLLSRDPSALGTALTLRLCCGEGGQIQRIHHQRRNMDAEVGGRTAVWTEGHSSIIVVEGGAGFGKTRILRTAVELAQELGLRTGYGWAAVGDQAAPMNPLFVALFDGPRLLVQRGERDKLHYLPEHRYWLLVLQQDFGS